MAQSSAGVFPGELFAYFGLACAVTGAAALLTSYLGGDWRLWWKARSWRTGQCTVVRTDPRLVYRVEVSGNAYEAERVGIGNWQSVYALSNPQMGARLECFYDPASPGEAMLTREYAEWWWLPGVWLLSAFLLATTVPGLAVGLWKWAVFRPDPPLTWGQWMATFYENEAWPFSVIGFTVLLPGLAMMWFMTAQPWWNWWQAQRWPEAQCEMTRSEVRGWRGGSGREAMGGYVMDIAFRYSYGGKEYTADTYAPWRLGGTEWLLQSSRAEEMEALLAKFAVGTKHTCYVSTENPRRAYLSRERSGFGMYVSAIGPFLVLLGWVVICSRR